MDKKTLTSLPKAQDLVLEYVNCLAEVIDCDVEDSLGSILAESQEALIDVPGHDNSAMDGYAVRCSDILKGGRTLPVSQVIKAGSAASELEAGTMARIFTGAPIPAGADAVVIQEDTKREDEQVQILEVPTPGQHVRMKGHDIRQGTPVLDSGHRLRPQDLGLLSSLGIKQVPVRKALTVAIINTGDEIIAPGQPLQPGQIYDSNSYTLQALLNSFGFKTLKIGIIADTLAETEEALSEASQKADCVISTGGVSVGEADFVRAAVSNLGEIALYKLAIKPGKPFSFGSIETTPFFGLPGNPVAVFVTFMMLVLPALMKMQGASQFVLPVIPAKAGFEIGRTGSRLEFIRVRMENNRLIPFADQGSSIMTSLSWADGLAEIPIDSTVSEGQTVNYYPFNGLLG